MMCGDQQQSGLDIHGNQTHTGLRCDLPAYHRPESIHRALTPDGPVGWSSE